MSAVLAPSPTRARIPRVTREAIVRSVRVGMESMRSLPPMKLSDWAAKNFVLVGDSSHQRGRWEAWPIQIGLMDAMSNDDIAEVDVMKSKRVGYTKILTASIGYDAAHRRRNQALWQPTDDDRDSFVKSEVEPMIDGVPAVRAARRLTKGVEDTIKYKLFRDSVVHLLGGKAARAYRRITVAAAKLDELDGFDQQIEKSADPVTLASGRLEGAPFPLLVCGSTPRLKGMSHVEHRAGLANAFMRYHITCPHCQAEHPLAFGSEKVAHGFKWERGKPETVRHVCPHCRESISQADYLRHWVGAWVCDKTGVRYGADQVWRSAEGEPITAPRHVAFHLWAAYSPQREWVDIVREFIAATAKHKAGDSGPLQGFVNETLGETFEVEYERTESSFLERRAKAEGLPLGIVPRGACVVFAFIDVQGDRWEYAAWAFGRGLEMWAIDYRVIYGNTADLAEWDAKIEPLIDASYPHATGSRLAISSLGIDTGFQTHAAYNFARKHARRKVYATKGDSQPGAPIRGKRRLMDVNVYGRLVRKGVALNFIGTDTAKDLLHGLLQVEKPGAGYVHFSAGLPTAFFDQLTAESRVPIQTVRGIEHRWQLPPGRRNEMLDCAVGCLFLAEAAGMSTWTDRVWARLEGALHPDLFDSDKTEAPPAPAEPAPKLQAAPAPPPPVHTYAQAPVANGLGSSDWSSRL